MFVVSLAHGFGLYTRTLSTTHWPQRPSSTTASHTHHMQTHTSPSVSRPAVGSCGEVSSRDAPANVFKKRKTRSPEAPGSIYTGEACRNRHELVLRPQHITTDHVFMSARLLGVGSSIFSPYQKFLTDVGVMHRPSLGLLRALPQMAARRRTVWTATGTSNFDHRFC